jgi:hypothetical protein
LIILLVPPAGEEREYVYDRTSHIGKLNRVSDEAEQRGLTVVDMMRDWKVIYPFQSTGLE